MGIQRLNSRHREMVNRLVYHGQTQREMARYLGYSEAHLSQIVNSPVFQDALRRETEIRDTLERESFHRIALEGLHILKQIVEKGEVEFTQADGTVRKVRLSGRNIVRVIQDILDRTGQEQVEA